MATNAAAERLFEKRRSHEEDTEDTATKEYLAGAGGDPADPPSQPSSPTSPKSIATRSSVKASSLNAKDTQSKDIRPTLESGQHNSSRLIDSSSLKYTSCAKPRQAIMTMDINFAARYIVDCEIPRCKGSGKPNDTNSSKPESVYKQESLPAFPIHLF